MKKIHSVLFFASILFMFYAIAHQWDQITNLEWEINPFLLLSSTTCLVGLFLLDGYGWHLILRSQGCQIPVKKSINIWLISSVARYLPGGIWAYASRAVLAKQEGINLTSVSISMYLETILLAASSFAVGIPAILYSTGLNISITQVILVWILLGLLLHPKLIRLLRFIPGRIGSAIASAELPSTKMIIALYFYYLVFWILFALTFCVFTSSIYSIEFDQYLNIGSSFALAFCIGLIIVIFPSGIGVREATLYTLLASILSPNICLVISIGSRIWTTIGEAVSVILAIFFKKKEISKS